MRNLLPLSAASILAISAALSLAAPASASEIATRCGHFGCDHIRCDRDGSRCVRYSDYDPRYNGYITAGRYVSGGDDEWDNSYDDRSDYGGRGDYDERSDYGDRGDYDARNDFGDYSRGSYGSYGGYGDYSGHSPYYYGGYYGGSHFVCDNGGERCYRSFSRDWNYREYYRQHGYRWMEPR